MIDFHGTWTVQNYGVAAGLVVVGLIGLYIAWKLTKSAVKLIFWFALLVLLLAAAGWLLEKGGFLPH
jgi:hypothetical protein